MTATAFRAGLVQMCSGRDPERNIRQAVKLVDRAAGDGADLVMTPEMTNIIATGKPELLNKVCRQSDDMAVAEFSAAARKNNIYLLAGSLALAVTGGQLVNRSILFSPQGDIVARYDKIHMFDVQLGNGESYFESAAYRAGRTAVTASLPWGKLGMTICYDVRFPALYRKLAASGADFITVPSAFTRPTGKAHWHTLLQARAIETGCFIFAPAQCGSHESGRRTWGHSLAVSPWGVILADLGDASHGTIVIDVNTLDVVSARQRIAALSHDREFEL